ncbi:thymus-specific serine protease [Polypterus senegalus]|uniref:thymus-specific serine protease n=1 Tax=Polypterus senegalus TaxID=55291 RepID=UPI001966571A|nr:thymus-specific serine protease [Polypterus senegalus]
MLLRPTLWLLLATLLGVYGGNVFRHIQRRVFLSKEQEARSHLARGMQLHLAPQLSMPKEMMLTQLLDHFNRQEKRTFKQRYYVNDAYWQKPHGPVFLYIGGEASLSPYSVQYGHHVEMAQQYKALLVALEHRYYGVSLNEDGLTDENIHFLSSQQALADLASFHLFITQQYNMSNSNKWICFGGSYPGSLSAWFRLKFPHLVYAAVSSSAPVRAQLDFTGYNQVVAASLSNPVVGGSKECLQAVRKAFQVVDKMLEAGNLSVLEKDFFSCGNLSLPEDQSQLVSNLADIFMGAVQYDQEITGSNIADVCNIMTSGPSYIQLIRILQRYLEREGIKCLDNSYQMELLVMRNTSLSPSGAGERQWYYQTCTEFGYYQTCEDSRCPFSPLMTLQSQVQLCQEVFGVPLSSVDESVHFTNEYYGADHPKSSRILFVNGDIDPWHALSVLSNQSRSELAILINGTSHCANMNSARPTDTFPLKMARLEIANQVGRWLRAAQEELSKSD